MFEKAKTLLNLLQEGEEGVGPRIYAYRSITAALFRSLEAFEQSLIIKLLSSNTLQLEIFVASDPNSKNKLKNAEDKLIRQYKIVEKYKEEVNSPYIYKLNQNFRDSLKQFLCVGLQNIFHMKTSKMEKCINEQTHFEARLKLHAYGGWSNLYKYMLNRLKGGSARTELTRNIQETLDSSSLMISSRGSADGDCFDFLLDSIRNQVSVFLYAYCKFLFKIKYRYLKDGTADKEAVSEGSILNLLFNLTLLLPMMSFSMKESEESLKILHIPSKLIQDVLSDLDSIGLVKIKMNTQGRVTAFAMTPLIHNVLNGTSPLEKEFKHNIIVETDFKIYAFSKDMDYLESLLSLFSVVKCKLPGVIICSIKEERINQAFNRGISPNHILKYLNTNAHYKVIEKKVHTMTEEDLKQIGSTYAFIPENVVEQLFIWNRVKDEEDTEE